MSSGKVVMPTGQQDVPVIAICSRSHLFTRMEPVAVQTAGLWRDRTYMCLMARAAVFEMIEAFCMYYGEQGGLWE